MTPFQRTPSGKIAKFRFHPEPLVWVEGREDIPFYQEILRNFACRLEVAGGKEECQKLASALIASDHPYVVVFDGDYEILESVRSPHRRVVRLNRYAIENYLFEKESTEQLCRNYAGVGTDETVVGDTFEAIVEAIESELSELVILDVAHNRAGTGQKILPDRAEPLCTLTPKIVFSSDRIQTLCAKGQLEIDAESIDEARELVSQFLEQKRLVDLLRGHIVFGILRHLIFNAVRRKIKKRPQIDDKALIMLLSTEVWQLTPSQDHKNLKRRLRRAVREAGRERRR